MRAVSFLYPLVGCLVAMESGSVIVPGDVVKKGGGGVQYGIRDEALLAKVRVYSVDGNTTCQGQGVQCGRKRVDSAAD